MRTQELRGHVGSLRNLAQFWKRTGKRHRETGLPEQRKTSVNSAFPGRCGNLEYQIYISARSSLTVFVLLIFLCLAGGGPDLNVAVTPFSVL